MQNTAGSTFRAVRRQRGWTQADLSHVSRMSLGDISRIETGRLVPTQNQLRRLADALNIPIADVAVNDFIEQAG